MVDNGHCLELVECRNKARRAGSFCFYSREVRAIVKSAQRLSHEIVGTFHSHPLSPGIPGESDIESAVDDSLMLVIDCPRKKARLWHIQGKRARELRLRPFRL
jgi:proteasome lid subunit RPN8/RPN11